MSWFKVDDHFWSHPRTGDLSDGATALWLRAGSWSAGHLTDGFVPAGKLRLFRGRQRSVTELLDAGLWSAVEGGYVFRDWLDYQPSREAVTARRDANRNRVNAWRERNGNAVTDSDGNESVTPPVTPPPTRPDPTRPEVSSTKRQSAARGTRLSPDWQPSLPLVDWTKKEAPGVNGYVEVQKFVNYWVAMPGQKGVKLDWDRTWKNWILRVKSDSPQLANVEPKKRFTAHAD